MTYRSNVGSVVGKDGWPGTMNRVDYAGGLYDMRRDPGEQYDMKSVHPEIVKELEQLADSMRMKLGDARMEIRGTENRMPGRLAK